MLVGKELSALLQILRNAGVTHYRTKEIHLELAPAQPRPAPAAVAPEASQIEAGDGQEDEDDLGDPRFLLERLSSGFVERTAQRKQAKS